MKRKNVTRVQGILRINWEWNKINVKGYQGFATRKQKLK